MKLTMMLPPRPWGLDSYPRYPESVTVPVSDGVRNDVRRATDDYYRRMGMRPEVQLTLTPNEARDLFSQPPVREACRYARPDFTSAWPWMKTLAAYLDVTDVVVEPDVPMGAAGAKEG